MAYQCLKCVCYFCKFTLWSIISLVLIIKFNFIYHRWIRGSDKKRRDNCIWQTSRHEEAFLLLLVGSLIARLLFTHLLNSYVIYFIFLFSFFVLIFKFVSLLTRPKKLGVVLHHICTYFVSLIAFTWYSRYWVYLLPLCERCLFESFLRLRLLSYNVRKAYSGSNVSIVDLGNAGIIAFLSLLWFVGYRVFYNA